MQQALTHHELNVKKKKLQKLSHYKITVNITTTTNKTLSQTKSLKALL